MTSPNNLDAVKTMLLDAFKSSEVPDGEITDWENTMTISGEWTDLNKLAATVLKWIHSQPCEVVQPEARKQIDRLYVHGKAQEARIAELVATVRFFSNDNATLADGFAAARVTGLNLCHDDGSVIFDPKGGDQ